MDEPLTLLTLAREIRFMIYENLINCTDVIGIYSQYDVAKEVDEQTIALLHVCRLMRIEVQEFFYKHQAFSFRSPIAMNKFLDKIGPYHASILSDVQIGPNMSRRRPDKFAVEFVDVSHARLRADEKVLAILCASEKLAKGKIYLMDSGSAYYTELCFVPKDVTYPSKVDTLIRQEVIAQPSEPPVLHDVYKTTTWMEIPTPDQATLKKFSDGKASLELLVTKSIGPATAENRASTT
ncbi:hypothetical protein LTR05_008108 [Lithohypha guttulata]|uniref:Uncharacterized protein n=1 Tax=Lithohypha guttulata TaxID=1690604 RepID=A0AAN7SV13_9EURO|nr:hypothetical protein LTR05_008108 [Lithohypha guttulata]